MSKCTLQVHFVKFKGLLLDYEFLIVYYFNRNFYNKNLVMKGEGVKRLNKKVISFTLPVDLVETIKELAEKEKKSG